MGRREKAASNADDVDNDDHEPFSNLTREEVLRVAEELVEMEQGPSIAEHIAKAMSRHEREMETVIKDMESETEGKSALQVLRSLAREEAWSIFLPRKPFDTESQDAVWKNGRFLTRLKSMSMPALVVTARAMNL